MDLILAGLNWEVCLFYLDGIIVFSNPWEELLQWLGGVFQQLCNAKLKLAASKCRLVSPEMSYLGDRVMRGGLLTDPSLLRAICKIPYLQNV